jgi:hypothetical protein
VGDVNSDCALDTTDWMQFRAGRHTDMTGLTIAQAYAQGDLNGDFANNHADFVLFKSSYVSAHGAAAFSRLLTVPGRPPALPIAFAIAIALSANRAKRQLQR